MSAHARAQLTLMEQLNTQEPIVKPPTLAADLLTVPKTNLA